MLHAPSRVISTHGWLRWLSGTSLTRSMRSVFTDSTVAVHGRRFSNPPVPRQPRDTSRRRPSSLNPLLSLYPPHQEVLGMASTADKLEDALARLQQVQKATYPPLSNKFAAVLVPMVETTEGVVEVILTLRSSNLTSHQGEVCLPGGKRDPDDIDDESTALREAEEEIGLNRKDATVICKLQPFLSKHLLSVTPVVATVPSTFIPRPCVDEVAEVFSMPLATFLSSTADHYHRDVNWQDGNFRVHYFQYGKYTVWGLTAAILIHVAQLAFGRAPAFENQPPGFSRPTMNSKLQEL